PFGAAILLSLAGRPFGLSSTQKDSMYGSNSCLGLTKVTFISGFATAHGGGARSERVRPRSDARRVILDHEWPRSSIGGTGCRVDSRAGRHRRPSIVHEEL